MKRFFLAVSIAVSFALLPSDVRAELASFTCNVTNAGIPVREAWCAVYARGERHTYKAHEYSGKPIKVDEGIYDIGIHFEKDGVSILKWIEGKELRGVSQDSYDLATPLTKVCYTITNGGSDLGNKVWFALHEDKSKNYIHYERSGKCFLAPSGSYAVSLHWEDDEIQEVKWLENEKIEGATFSRSVELNTPASQVRFKILNNGVDVGHKAWWGVYPLGNRTTYIGYKYSNDQMRIKAGAYDIGIQFTDGDLKKVKWLEDQKLEGVVEQTVELGEAATQAKVVVTNGGLDVGHKATWAVYAPGERGRYLAYKHSGESMTIGAGTYDIGIEFADGDAKSIRWLENQVFGAEYHQTVELGMALADVTVHVTNHSADVGSHAWWGLYDLGERSNYLAYKHNNEAMTFPEGTYDLGVHFEDGAVDIIRWIPSFELKGKTEKTVELSAGMADLTVRVTRAGKPLEKAWCGAYKDRKTGSYEAYAYSEKPMRLLNGTYDVGCFYAEAGASAEKWIEKQDVQSDTQLNVELDLKPATLLVSSHGAKSERSLGAQVGASVGDTNIALILDASGSMVAKVENQKNRLDVAKEVLSDVIDSLPSSVQVELQVYGTAPKAAKNCEDTKRLYPLGPVDTPRLKSAIASLEPSGYTPIAYSLERVAASLPKGKNNSLVLVTDGIESCNGDPCEAAAHLAAEGLLTRSFVVGFGLDLDKGHFLSCVGKYYPASDRKALQAAMREVVSESIKPMTGHVTVYKPGKHNEIIVQGSLDEKLTLPAGTYDVAIEAGGRSYRWEAQKVEGQFERALAP